MLGTSSWAPEAVACDRYYLNFGSPCVLPVPGINQEQFAQAIQNNNPLIGLLDIFSSEADFSTFRNVALSLPISMPRSLSIANRCDSTLEVTEK